jgi:hypothetical protein
VELQIVPAISTLYCPCFSGFDRTHVDFGVKDEAESLIENAPNYRIRIEYQ